MLSSNLVGKVIYLSPQYTGKVRPGWGTGKNNDEKQMCDGLLQDEVTQKVYKFILWREEIGKVKTGDTVKIGSYYIDDDGVTPTIRVKQSSFEVVSKSVHNAVREMVLTAYESNDFLDENKELHENDTFNTSGIIGGPAAIRTIREAKNEHDKKKYVAAMRSGTAMHFWMETRMISKYPNAEWQRETKCRVILTNPQKETIKIIFHVDLRSDKLRTILEFKSSEDPATTIEPKHLLQCAFYVGAFEHLDVEQWNYDTSMWEKTHLKGHWDGYVHRLNGGVIEHQLTESEKKEYFEKFIALAWKRYETLKGESTK